MKVPVLFLIYNRPGKAAKLLQAIRKYKPSKLYIAADGPRLEKDREAVTRTREIASKVDWKCEVLTLFRADNLGCKVAVSSGIDWFFENEEMGIILEDDCLPNDSFFKFCEELLKRYRHNEKIGMIAGTNQFSHEVLEVHDSYFFGTNASIWGWASWGRAWKHYDVEMRDWPSLKKDNDFLRNHTYNILERLRRQGAYDDVYRNKIDTWDYQWTFTRQKADLLSIIPVSNLVENIGMDSEGTHLKNKDYVGHLEAKTIDFPLLHPDSMVPNHKFDRALSRQIISEGVICNILYLLIKRPFMNFLASKH
ncbi:MAG: nucleotide-diphospho-sugar transferase [Cyclobacteriaceae bacterium]